ncbi:MAG: serine/threonine-protein kinase [Myxococcota bacterium]
MLELEGALQTTTFFDPSDEPKQVGPYTITGVLGRGGMGVVYRAEQRSPVERTVALKVIRPGLESPQLVERLVGEQQALALMNHVNVATVYRMGEADAGPPYIAIEYVPGTNLTRHCDNARATMRSRVLLFLQVCDGVQHAHQKGIIHRDLKPNNVLVAVSPDQPPTPKLIDFGIAKSLTRKLNPDAAATQLGLFMGTPQYSSPEQMTGRYSEVDTRSDIYSVGVILYELLAGTPPRDATEFDGRSQFELAEMFESSEVPTLLSRFTQLENQQEMAKRRRASVDEVQRVLSSDLSWIVLRCLERDPDGRYPSVQNLRNDLARWLEGKPVEARRSSRLYRARKFVRRHWRSTLAAGALSLALIAATVAAAAGWVSARRSAEQARQAAESAELAASFQTELLRSLDPQALGEALRARLVQGVSGLLSESGLPSAAADARLARFEALLSSVNITDLQVETLEEVVFSAAEKSIADNFSESPLLQATLLQSLATTLIELGLLDAAERAQNEAIVIRETHLPPGHELLLESFESKQSLRELQQDFRRVLADSARVVAARRRLGDREGLARALQDHARTLTASGFVDEALEHSREALELRQALHGPESREALIAIGDLGRVLMAAERLSTAEDHLRRSIKGLQKIEFPGKPAQLDELRLPLAAVIAWMGRYAEAEILVRSVLESSFARLGEKHPLTARARFYLALVYEERGDFEAAEELFLELVEYLSAAGLPVDYPLVHLAHVRIQLGKLDEAERNLESASTSESTMAPKVRARIHAMTLAQRAELLRMRQRYPDAVRAGRDATKEVEVSRLSPTVRGRTRASLGRVYLEMGQFETAEAELTSAWSSLTELDGGQRPRFLRSVIQDMISLYTQWLKAKPGPDQQSELERWNERLSKLGTTLEVADP